MKFLILILSLTTYSAFSLAKEVNTDCIAMNESRVKDLKNQSNSGLKQTKNKGSAQ